MENRCVEHLANARRPTGACRVRAHDEMIGGGRWDLPLSILPNHHDKQDILDAIRILVVVHLTSELLLNSKCVYCFQLIHFNMRQKNVFL